MNDSSILLVEDHPDDAFLTLYALRKRQIDNVMVMNEAAKALDYLLPISHRQAPLLPRLIIVDLKLPKMDGFELIGALREHEVTSRVPVVVLSSSVSPAERERCRALGVEAFFEKPLDPDVFTDYIRQLH